MLSTLPTLPAVPPPAAAAGAAPTDAWDRSRHRLPTRWPRRLCDVSPAPAGRAALPQSTTTVSDWKSCFHDSRSPSETEEPPSPLPWPLPWPLPLPPPWPLPLALPLPLPPDPAGAPPAAPPADLCRRDGVRRR
eukprot:TRINITY_DN1487_c0_g1_i18.p3 TRINITY_DN1487_c0_g1~~TRINITY_DN1487_c0_g1_i18.p3  ORF type:complete len:134 (+),score=31.16 TRINITY_DN1487_c0_g1_i18:638-1039(+)